MTNFPVLAFVLAGVAHFAVGGLWYSPLLFSKVWLDALGHEPKGSMPVGMAFTAAASFLTAFCIVSLAEATQTTGVGPTVGLAAAAWLGFGLTSSIGHYAFAAGLKLGLIDLGHTFVATLAAAAVIGLLR